MSVHRRPRDFRHTSVEQSVLAQERKKKDVCQAGDFISDEGEKKKCARSDHLSSNIYSMSAQP